MISTKNKPLSKGFQTVSIHAGESKNDPFGSHVPPIYQTSTYVFESVESGAKAFRHEEGGASHVYSRLGNPTVEHLERSICALETYGLDNADDYVGMAFGSGMAAISTAIISLANNGHIIAQDALYGCTSQFLKEEAPLLGMSVSFIDTTDIFNLEIELEKHPNTKLIYFESIANPTMTLSDIEHISAIASEYNVKVMVDNTFATPYHIRPLHLGADVTVHSTTKYLGGHGTIVGGALVAKKELLEESNAWLYRKNLGGISGPNDAWLTTMGLKTFPLRMQRHNENAMKVAEFLDHHPAVSEVFYPGLESHPQHNLAKRMMENGFGGMIAFELKGGYEAGVTVMNKVELCGLAVSLGSVDSLIQHPSSMTHSVVDEEIKKQAGITEGLVRLSVGIEDVEDIIEDLEQALSFV